jgi:hypothetical protein
MLRRRANDADLCRKPAKPVNCVGTSQTQLGWRNTAARGQRFGVFMIDPGARRAEI